MTTDTPSMSRRSMLRGTITIAGAAIVLPSMAGLAGCSSAPASLDTHKDMIAALADRIIPATDTPGASAAGVPQYIADVFADFFTDDQQSEFAAGLDGLASTLDELGGGDFAALSPDKQDAALTKFVDDQDAAGQFEWQQIRDMTIFGYYTSEIATQELSFEEVPGRYEACIPLAEVDRAWLNRGV